MNNENTFSDIINKLDKEFVDSFKTNNKINTDCEKCLHKVVCKEIENWNKYCEEHIRLREKSILFDEEPKCPYYIENKDELNKRRMEHLKNAKDICNNTDKEPVSIKFGNGSEIKTIPHNGNIRGKRAEMDIGINIDNLASIDDNDINDLINKMIRDGIFK